MASTCIQPLHTTARQVYPFVQFHEELGEPLEKKLLRAGMPILDYEQSDTPIHESKVVEFLSAMSVVDNRDEYVLEVSRRYAPDALLYSEFFNARGSGWSALIHIVRCLKRIAPTPAYWLQRDGAVSWFHRGQHPIKQGIRNMELYVVDKMIDIMQGVSAKPLVPEVIKLQTTEIGNLREYERYAETTIMLDQPATAIAIPHDILVLPSRSHQQDDFLNRVRSVLSSIEGRGLSQSTPTVAETLCMSQRNFQRSLNARNVTFRALYDEEVYRRSQSYLLNTDMSVRELSRQLGFSSSSNFTRSFHRITGVSPANFRSILTSD